MQEEGRKTCSQLQLSTLNLQPAGDSYGGTAPEGNDTRRSRLLTCSMLYSKRTDSSHACEANALLLHRKKLHNARA